MIVRTKLGEDKLKFTVTYLDCKKLPKDLALNVRNCIERIGEIDTLIQTLSLVSEQKQDLRTQYNNLELEIDNLKKELEQVQLDSDNTEETLSHTIQCLQDHNNNLEAKYQDVLSLSNRQIWAMVALAAVSLISLSLYFSSL